MKKMKWFVVAVLALAIWAACRKTDRAAGLPVPEDHTGKFFNRHPPSDPLVTALQQKMQRENAQQPFIENIIRQIGYPRWDKAMVVQQESPAGRSQSGDSSIVYIPFVRDSQNMVNAALLFKLSPTDTSYQYLADWQYASYGFDTTGPGLNARDIFHLFARFDGAVFGRTIFKVTDARLFGGQPGQVARARLRPYANTGNRSNVLVYTTVCDEVDWCYTPPGGTPCPDLVCTVDCPDFMMTVLECTSVWVDNGWTPASGGSGGSGTGGGSTGGGGGYPPPTCGGVTTRTDQDPVCGPGWVPPENPTPAPNANQSIIDSLQGYPCAQGILSILPCLNDTAEAILYKVFGISDKVNVIFKADSTLNSSINANTEATRMEFDPVTGIFKIRIIVNTWVLKNSSQEFIAKTFFHEAIHAMIDYHWKKYKSGLLDSTTFKAMYPKIWEFKRTALSASTQHLQIAASYVDDLESVLHSFNNMIPDSVNRAISWSGLFETPAWRAMGNDTFQLNRLRLTARGGTGIAAAQAMKNLKLHKCY